MWRAGAVLAAVAAVGTILSGSGPPGEPPTGVPLGGLASLLTAIAALIPGRRMPDWPIGVSHKRVTGATTRAPLVALGWALAGLATAVALLVEGPAQALFAALTGAVAPVAIGRSLDRFLTAARRFRDWGASRALDYEPEWRPPPKTPLLRQGDYRYAVNVLAGPLAGSEDARLFQLGAVTVEQDQDSSSMSTKRYTVLTVPVPDPTSRLALCVCAPRSPIPGYDALASIGKKRKRVDLVSSEFEARWELAIDRDDDESWLRRLFEPTLTEQLGAASAGWGWELEAGLLVIYEPGWRDAAAELDRLVARGELIAGRIRAEVAETSGLG